MTPTLTFLLFLGIPAILVVAMLSRRNKPARVEPETPSDRLTKRLVEIIDGYTEDDHDGGMYVANPGTKKVEINGKRALVTLLDGHTNLVNSVTVYIDGTDIALSEANQNAIYNAFERWERRLLTAWHTERREKSERIINDLLQGA